MFVLILFLILILFFFTEFADGCHNRTIDRDGFCVLQNPTYVDNFEKLRQDVLQKLPDGYAFLDYEYTIQDAVLTTFHRDVTSSSTTFNTKFPTFTLILYKYDGDLLSVCPNSHREYPFVFSRIWNIQGTKGTAILFDCDILHAGCANECKKRDVVQYKLCHVDDIEKLKSLNGIHKIKKEQCVSRPIARKMSYFFQLPINTIFRPLLIKKYNNDSIISKIQSTINIRFYNND